MFSFSMLNGCSHSGTSKRQSTVNPARQRALILMKLLGFALLIPHFQISKSKGTALLQKKMKTTDDRWGMNSQKTTGSPKQKWNRFK